jgi:hypothetical protein
MAGMQTRSVILILNYWRSARCTLRYTGKDITHVVFVRPTHAGKGSVATKRMEELEAKVKTAVEAGIKLAQP